MTTRAAIEARHVPVNYDSGWRQCGYDNEEWPCDTAVTLALLDEARGHEKANAVLAGKWHHDSIQTHIELAEAEAREARLRAELKDAYIALAAMDESYTALATTPEATDD